MVVNLSYFAKKELHPKIFVQFSFKLVKLVLSNLNAFWSSKSRKESDIDILMVNSAINLVEAWKEGQAKRKKKSSRLRSLHILKK
jgi:intracellular sulfur oxidation DsrE/DsrF family protein